MNVLKLKSGVNLPLVGLGTWKSQANQVESAVKCALEAGYRLIDCAYVYGNENEVGRALQHAFNNSLVKRSDICLISKLWNTRHHPEDVKPSVKESLASLGVDYIDIYLMHWPLAFKRGGENFPKDESGNVLYDNTHYLETYKEMEKLVDKGLVKEIGFSNFNSKQIQDVLDHCRIKPTVLQVEIHPFFSQEKLVKFCQDRDIAVIAYSPFGSPDRPWATAAENEKSVFTDPVIGAIATKHNRSPAQVVLRWLYQRKIISIPKSVTPARIQDNLKILDFELSAEEMTSMMSLNQNLRRIVPMVERNGVRVFRDGAHPHFPFHEEF